MAPEPVQRFKPSSRLRELSVAVICFSVAWLWISMLCTAAVWLGYGPYVELFNGATWPPLFIDGTGSSTPSMGPVRSLAFCLILGFRTTLNLGIVLSAAFIFYLLATGQLETWFMSKLESVLNTRDTALAAYLIKTMRDAHQTVSPELRDQLYAAAEQFRHTEAGQRFLHSFVKASKESQRLYE